MKNRKAKIALILIAALLATVLTAGVVFVGVTARPRCWFFRRGTKQFHVLGCRHFTQADDTSLMMKKCTWFDMLIQGYKPCPDCIPYTVKDGFSKRGPRKGAENP